MINKNYRIKIKIEDIEIEVEGDKEFVENKISELRKELLNSSIKAKSKVRQTITKVSKKGILLEKISLAEFYKQNQPIGHNSIFAFFAYWLEIKENKEEFQTKDILDCYDKVRIPKPKNPAQHISDLLSVKKAYFITGSKKGWYKLSHTGKEFIEHKLSFKNQNK